MEFSTFDVIPKCIHINVFKVGKLWLFKYFFDNRELFEALLDHYNKDLYRFEFKSTGARNNALKLLERNGFDYDLVENLQSYVVKHSVATKETAIERLFLMKDSAAVGEAVSLGAQIVDGEISFWRG